MASIRQKIQQQQNRKAPKRPREPSDFDDSSIFPQQEVDGRQSEHSDAFESEDEENQPVIEFQRGTTARGAVCLWHEGYRYTRNLGNLFRCSNRDCPATAKMTCEETSSGELGPKEHNHLPDPVQRQAELRRNDIKKRTRNDTRQKPSRVLAEVRASASDEAYVAMGTDHALEQVMRRQRKKEYGNVDQADPLAVVLPAALLMKDGESCLLYDSRDHRVGEPDVVLVFAHPKLLDILKRSRKVSVDGTFKVAPSAWTQAFVIGAFVNRRLAMCAHALLPGKNRRYYTEALQAIKDAIAPSTPARVICDFEVATIQAMHETFPATVPTGCLFHFTQAVFKKWLALGLTQIYADDEEHGEASRNSFRMVLALSLIPEQHVRRAFSLIISHAPDGLAAFFGYFARVYIGLNAYEVMMGADAFTPDAERSRRSSMASALDHNYTGQSIQFGLPSPAPSTPTMSVTTDSATPRWELPITRAPRYALSFWNVHDRARSMVEKTNCHEGIASPIFAPTRASSVVIRFFGRNPRRPGQTGGHCKISPCVPAKTPHKIHTEGTTHIMNILALLSLQMQGYIGGLRTRNIIDENNVSPD